MNGVARALVVYGYQPSGHSAAAAAIEEAGRKAGLFFSRVEIAADHHPRAGLLVARGYHGLLRAAPGAYGAVYRSPWARGLLRSVRAAYLSLGGGRRLREGVRRSGAEVVVCPQAAVAAVLSAARARGELDLPVVSVLTDFGVHPFWADPPADLILAPNEMAVDNLVALGVPRERLRATGIPVHPAFGAAPDRALARRILGLPASAPVVLLSGGGKGLGGLEQAAQRLLRANARVRLLVLCGSADRLRAALSSHSAADGRLRAFGPQPPEFVSTLMSAADLHLGKPGGLSAGESLVMSLPMVLLRPLPGQEEANARHLLAVGAAILGGSAPDAAAASAALLDRPSWLASLREAAQREGRPSAAADAAREVLDLLSVGKRERGPA